MSHGAEEHLEHAEHDRHAALDPFDRRVAMTIAIVAAVLACVTMMSHREHTETLRLQNEANICYTNANDQWNYSQAKKERAVQHDLSAELLKSISTSSIESSSAQEQIKSWKNEAEK